MLEILSCYLFWCGFTCYLFLDYWLMNFKWILSNHSMKGNTTFKMYLSTATMTKSMEDRSAHNKITPILIYRLTIDYLHWQSVQCILLWFFISEKYWSRWQLRKKGGNLHLSLVPQRSTLTVFPVHHTEELLLMSRLLLPVFLNTWICSSPLISAEH